MESTAFSFDEEQRQILAKRLQRLPPDRVQSFLNRCESAITEWQAEWPVGYRLQHKKDSAGLRALGKALLNARCEIEKLPQGASSMLWVHWLYARQKDITKPHHYTHRRMGRRQPQQHDITKPQKAKRHYTGLLLELEQLASTLADDIAHAGPGGIIKSCESGLTDKLVQAFMDSSFDKKPSAAPNGIFMSFMAELTQMLTLPGGKKLTLGKDIVAASIKWHLDREEQFTKWEAGMYESQ